MNDGEQVYLTVKLDIAQFKLGHIYPAKVFQKAVGNRFGALITCEGVENVLNLDSLASHPELANMEIELSNPAQLSLLSSAIDSKMASADFSSTTINGIRLTNNNLGNITSFDATNLQKIRFQMFDLRNNKVIWWSRWTAEFRLLMPD